MIQLLVNDILNYNDSNEIIRERILWIDEKYEYCFTIQLDTNKTIIKEKLIKQLINAIENNSVEISTDSISELVYIDNEYIKKYKDSIDKKFEIINYAISKSPEPYIFYHKYRGKVVEAASTKFNLSKTVIYKYLRLYWQGGKIKFSLIPKYNNCGAPGREKNFSKKTGRPSYEEKILNKKIGIPITEEIKDIFQKTLDKYYRKPNEMSLRLVYKLMIKDFFTEVSNGQLVVKSRYQIPNLNQFYNWVRNKSDIRTNKKKRMGDRKYQLKNRQLPSNTLQEVLGPGSRYEIDSTICDIYLVSRIDKSKVIGRPTLYIIVDVFSRLITGMNISFECASWNGSASTIYNCTENKVKFCEKYGIKINSDEWPSQGLPNIILADRGELIGPIGEHIVSNLNITLENTPTGRGDRKPIVEQMFHRLNARIKALLPGAVKKDHKERGERDYKLDAKLDIYEYTQIVLIAIKNINSSLIDDYQLTKEMIADGVRVIPIELWKWGMLNKTGKLKRINDDLLKLKLMKHDTASITERGIKYRKMLYTTEVIEKKGLFELARINGHKTIPIVFDDRDMTFIYFYDKLSNRYIRCELKNEYKMYTNLTLDEVKDFQINSIVEKKRMQDYINQNEVDMYSEIEKIMKSSAKNLQSVKVSKKDMKYNKRLEIVFNNEINKMDKFSYTNHILQNEFTNYSEDDNKNTIRELEALSKIKMRRKNNEK
ncbi:transposon Tn7 transposition protein TnsB [Clostridium homopropionicum DSM 5847]|uniref:Transposon Tn7 transposition protein TnsB n=1 Tax=Clostridium homopropionicum DSM 5847 TaxID=1121318 RepID=A0A0L6ZA32_9CLOT|nr:DDE-type integrase/transposase/recombinase [Clostridium homopropionicum]KOA19831.1 transposon Tn7 transposition protein TnsB [Clostridium homopropionicum DSM 5847]SFF76488.1 Integrase core domain-containing protein [Clostridium homopropionicum]